MSPFTCLLFAFLFKQHQKVLLSWREQGVYYRCCHMEFLPNGFSFRQFNVNFLGLGSDASVSTIFDEDIWVINFTSVKTACLTFRFNLLERQTIKSRQQIQSTISEPLSTLLILPQFPYQTVNHVSHRKTAESPQGEKQKAHRVIWNIQIWTQFNWIRNFTRTIFILQIESYTWWRS